MAGRKLTLTLVIPDYFISHGPPPAADLPVGRCVESDRQCEEKSRAGQGRPWTVDKAIGSVARFGLAVDELRSNGIRILTRAARSVQVGLDA